MKNIYPKGIKFYKPNQLTPSFVRGSVRFDVKPFIKFLRKHEKEGIVDTDLLRNEFGIYYFVLNEYNKKEENKNNQENGK